MCIVKHDVAAVYYARDVLQDNTYHTCISQYMLMFLLMKTILNNKIFLGQTCSPSDSPKSTLGDSPKHTFSQNIAYKYPPSVNTED